MTLSSILEKYSKDSDKIVHISSFETPVGKFVAAGDESYVYMVVNEDSKKIEKHVRVLSTELTCKFKEGTSKVLDLLKDEMEAYFEGNVMRFSVPIKTFGSDFQKDVWNKLLELPFGTQQTYGDLAKCLGRAASHSRAVGAACGANAHLIVIPCHRLVATGSKGGFSAGIDRKDMLLAHEKKYITKF